MTYTIEELRDAAPQPRVALVLGSGLSGVVDAAGAFECGYSQIEGAPSPSAGAKGHSGRLILGEASGIAVAVFEGRFHLYQGVSPRESAWPADLAAALGVDVLISLNASGAVSDRLAVGTVGVVSDHLSMFMPSPLAGHAEPDGTVRFLPTADAYDEELRNLAMGVAAGLGHALPEVVYAALPGPQYETAAEVRALASLGAEVVGMSTVPEVLVARSAGLRVLALTYVANAAGVAELSHEEVLRAGEGARDTMAALVAGILSAL